MYQQVEWFSVEEGYTQRLSTNQATEKSKEKNIIKWDGYRDQLQWTVFGPNGRVGDFATWDEAVENL
jgi:hypothetical protein